MSDSDEPQPEAPPSTQSRLSLRQSASPSIDTKPPAQPSIDLNADLGEGFANDRALLDLVTSASISCGAHAGTSLGIRQTLRDAASRGVCIGAHPGYADRENFGRREQTLSTNELIKLISTQIDDLLSLAGEEGATIKYVKPHGALYNQAQREPQVARAVVEAVCTRGWPLLGQPGTVLETIAREQGVTFIAEGFPDRRYRADGSLVPRREANALLHEPHAIEEQVMRLIESLRVATLCVHGDEPGAVETAALIRRVLTAHGISVRSFGNGPG